MTKERKILLNYLLKQYKQSLKESYAPAVGEWVKLDLGELKNFLQEDDYQDFTKALIKDGHFDVAYVGDVCRHARLFTLYVNSNQLTHWGDSWVIPADPIIQRVSQPINY